MIRFLTDCVCAFFLGQLAALGFVVGSCLGIALLLAMVF